MNQIVLNIIIAFLWVLFQDEDHFKFSTFFSGYLIGLIVIYILHRFFSDDFYVRKIWVAIKFLGVYLYQLITSSISTINYILLTILIIITPGSTVIRISQDSKKFFIHSIDV